MAGQCSGRTSTSLIRQRAHFALLYLLCTAFPTVQAQATPANASDVSLTAFVDRQAFPLNETALLTVLVEWEGPADRYRFGWPETPGTRRVSIVGSKRGSHSWVDDAGEHSRQEFTYILRPEEIGKAGVGAVRLTYWDTADTARTQTTLMTLPISLEVLGPSRASGSLPWGDLGIAATTLAVVGLTIWWLRFHRTGRTAQTAEPATLGIDPLDEHLEALARARNDGDVARFYDEVVAVVRIGLGRTLNEPMTGLGTDDLVRLLEKPGWPDEIVTSLRGLLEKADRKRFAPSRPEEQELVEDEAVVRKVADLTKRPASTPASVAEERNGDRSGN